MTDLSDADITSLLSELRYEAPPIDSLWTPSRESRWRIRRAVFFGIATAVIVAASATAFAASQDWFAEFVPQGACVTGDPACGADSHQIVIVVDHVHDVVGLELLVRPGLSRDRLTSIAADAAAGQHASRVIVYLLDDLPQGAMNAGMPELPASPTASAPPPLGALKPYWRMTYDVGPGGPVALWP